MRWIFDMVLQKKVLFFFTFFFTQRFYENAPQLYEIYAIFKKIFVFIIPINLENAYNIGLN